MTSGIIFQSDLVTIETDGRDREQVIRRTLNFYRKVNK